MYKEGDTVELAQDIGNKDKGTFRASGTECKLIRISQGSDLTSSMVQVLFNDGKVLVLPELVIKPINTKESINALIELNKKLMKDNPRLRVNHPNVFIRLAYRLYYGVLNKLGKLDNKKGDISKIKKIINEE